jgi:hypothetical protein
VAVNNLKDNQSQIPANLSVIDTMNLQAVQQTMQKISSFQAVVKSTLKDGHDYGTIPGTGSKPTLLKPGAEKILMLMGLTSEYEIVTKVEDYETGFFAYTIRCLILRQGMKITEGLGHANTREKRYVSGKQQDAYTLANTVLKMAKKRSQVDAALTVAALSEIFTQDVEDFGDDLGAPRQYKQSNGKMSGMSTVAQQKKIHVEAEKKGYNVEPLVKERSVESGSTKDLTKQQASDLISWLIEAPPAQAEGQQELGGVEREPGDDGWPPIPEEASPF